MIRLPWLVALGASVTVGLGVYTLLTVVVENLGMGQIVGPYLVLGLVAIPLVLTLAERAAVVPGSGGLYRLARNSGMLWVGHFSGWLMLGGYAALAALLAWGIALGADLLLRELFLLELDPRWIAAAILALAAAAGLQGMRAAWRTRVGFIVGSLLFLLLLSIGNLITMSLRDAVDDAIPRSFEVFTVTAFLASGLWGLDFILSVRDQVRRPTKSLLPALGLTIAVGSLLGAGAALALGPNLVTASLTPLIGLAAEARILPEIIARTAYAVFALGIVLIALNRALLNVRNLLFAMSRDGYLPEQLRDEEARTGLRTSISLLVPFIGILLILSAPIELLIGFAALTFLWAVGLTHAPDLVRSKPNLAATWLPFHPLFPGLTTAVGLLLPTWLGLNPLVTGGAWLAAGGIAYALYSRERGLAVRRREIVVGEVGEERLSKPGYRVMVDVTRAVHADRLIETAANFARERGGDLLILSTLQLEDSIPPYLKQQRAIEEWERLKADLVSVGAGSADSQPLVRLSPNHADGLLEAISEERVDLLIVEWQGSDDPDQIQSLDRILRTAQVELGIAHGKIPQNPARLLVPTSGGPHAPTALRLANELTSRSGGRIKVTNVVTEELTDDALREAQAKIEATQELAAIDGEIQSEVVHARTVHQGILAEAENVDLLLIGSTREGVLERSQFGGIPTQIARSISIPTIISRARESQRALRLQRVWGAISDPLPKLSARQHAAVAQSMREAAVPTIDFYVLITLASSIATLGLLQNSGAVIIGAMLVAPLMAPILAMGMSMVMAETPVFVRGVEATLKGVTLAILVGLVIVIISPITDSTPEILARTQPNVLDLLVALASGAAAGYAISRSEVAAAMPGVAISAALVPPLCVVGYGLGVSNLAISGGALLLFTTNLIAIVLAAGITFLALGFQPERSGKGELARGLRLTAISLAGVFVILAIVTVQTLEQENREKKVFELFEQGVAAQAGRIDDLTIEKQGSGFLLTTTITDYAGTQLDADDLELLEDQISAAVGGPVTLDATIVEAERVQTELGGLNALRRLEQEFVAALDPERTELVRVVASEINEGFRVEATLVAIRPLGDQELIEIQDQLQISVDTPVELHVITLAGDLSELPGN